jgi:hypothetical protein
MNNRKLTNIKIAAAVLVTFSLLVLILGSPYLTFTEVGMTVLEKRVEVVSGKNVYVVVTDKEVFENKDSWRYGKTNNLEIHEELQEGKFHVLQVYGYNIPFLSIRRNILGVINVDEEI